MEMIQSLESRRYLSTFTLIDTTSLYDTVYVVGRRNRSDEIVVTNDPKRASKILIVVNSVGQKYARSSGLRVDIRGRGGDDHIVINRFASWVSFVSGDGGNDVLEIRDPTPPALGEFSSYFSPTLDGGDGNDRLIGGPVTAGSLNGGDGNDTLIAGAAGDRLDGGAGDDSLVGGGGAQPSYHGELYGGAGNDTLKAGANGDHLDGGTGDDSLISTSAGDVLLGGKGDDSLISNAAGNALFGGNGNDVLIGTADRGAVFDGGRGNDTIIGSDGADTITGGEGSDNVNGRGGNDLINGDLGWPMYEWDLVGPNDDVLSGGDGDDTIYANPGNDQVNGDAGDDHLYGDQGNDVLAGGIGNDTLGGDAQGITEYSNFTPGDDRLDGGPGDDWLLGPSLGNDGTIPEHDTMTGGLGNDIIDAFVETGDVITDRDAGDFVPDEVRRAISNVIEHGKQITLHLDAPLFYNSPGLPPGFSQTSPDLSFYSFTDDQITIADTPQRRFVVKDFFRIWALPIDAGNVGRYRLTSATVNGVSVSDIANYQPNDGDVIIINTATA